MKWLICIIAFLYFSSCNEELLCERLINKASNEGILRDLVTDQFDNLKQEKESCIESLVLTGNYKALETFTTMLNANGIKFREALSESIVNIIAKLEAIVGKREENNTPIETKTATPLFRWAQSMEKIFVEIKFSFKWDYPGCSIENSIEIVTAKSNEQNIIISAKCELSDIPVLFNLDLPLLKLINAEKSEFKLINQIYYFELIKKEREYWPSLVTEEKKIDYPQMSIWYEMKSKYESELKEYEKEEEDKSYEEIERELKEQMRQEKKNKTNKKKKQKQKKTKNKSTKSDL